MNAAALRGGRRGATRENRAAPDTVRLGRGRVGRPAGRERAPSPLTARSRVGHDRRRAASRPAAACGARPPLASGLSMARPRLTVWHAVALGVVLLAWAMWNVLLA